MNRPEEARCVRCGAAIPGGAADGLCPACLMSGALKQPGDEARTVVAAPGVVSSAVPSREFPCSWGGYRVLRLLGQGGMGTVYEAEHVATGRCVALKVLGQNLDGPDMRQRFLREGRLAAGIRHPNSLYVFGAEEIQGHPAITMEIAGGGTLKALLKRRGPLPVPKAVDAMLDVVAGLEAAFAGGVLHRDVKPSNCFVSPDGSVKVGDFGLSVSTLAKSDSLITATGVIMGTPAYAPPEQLRGDELDVRADIYSVGATLFTLLTGRAPFEGENAVQVVARAVNQKPPSVTELREEVPAELDAVVARCLAKEPNQRYADYPALREALLPFSSREPEPASTRLRAPAGWIDYLIAFLIPYVTLMLSLGSEAFHFGPLFDRTLHSARYYLAFVGFGLLYFTMAEGIWGAGLGKSLLGLRVVRPRGRVPGVGRAFLRILIPLLGIEAVRIPILMGFISATEINQLAGWEIAIYSGATGLCPWIPVLFFLRARRENRFTTLWDRWSGTRVVVKPKALQRPVVEPVVQPENPAENARLVGPYRVVRERVPNQWLVASDPVLRRQVWLLRRTSAGPGDARRGLARPGRLRWLQQVESDQVAWDAFEAPAGAPLLSLIAGGQRLPWATLRVWLHDLASELWAASGDHTLPAELGLDHIWITAQGCAILLDQPWPETATRHERFPVGDLAGQQRFLNAMAVVVDPLTIPLHARPVLQNLAEGRFEKLSFLTGTLRGLLDKPAQVTRSIRAGSIFMLPVYVGIMVWVGLDHAEGIRGLGGWLVLTVAFLVLGVGALVHLMTLPFRWGFSQSLFGLVLLNEQGERAGRMKLLARWLTVWVPLFLPAVLMGLLMPEGKALTSICLASLLLLWAGAAVYAVVHPNRGLQDRWAGTWIVRR